MNDIPKPAMINARITELRTGINQRINKNNQDEEEIMRLEALLPL